MSQGTYTTEPVKSDALRASNPVRRLSFIERPAPLRYLIAFISITLVLFAEKILTPWSALHAPLGPLLAMILALAYYVGAGPILMATAIGAVYIELFFSSPKNWIGDSVDVDHTRLFDFVMLGTFESWLSHQWHKSIGALRDREQKLR